MSKVRNPRTPSWEAWYGKRVRITKGSGMDEFAGKIGTVIGIEDEYLRIQFDSPVFVKGVGMVRDDLWMPYTVRKIREKSPRWNPRILSKGRFIKISFSSTEVAAFKRRWPASGLPDAQIWFEFDSNNGDLVDMGSTRSLKAAEGSGALVGLSQDAQNLAVKRKLLPSYVARNPGAKWHTARADELRVERRRYSHIPGQQWDYLNERVKENDRSAGESWKKGMKNPTRRKTAKRPSIATPSIGLIGVIALVGYLVYRNR